MENLKTEKTEKMTKLFFNNRPYTFSDANLITICDYLIANESIDEYEKKYVLSFIKNSIVRKTYDEMDYHEFIIEDSFRISQLLCNVDNIFGRKVAEEFAKEIGSIFGEVIAWDSTNNYFDSIIASGALECWNRTSASKEFQKDAFQRMLGLLFLYDCVSEDYEQTITNVDNFGNVGSVNGIVVEKAEYRGHLMLRPIEHYYDVGIDEYMELCDIFIPPILLSAIFNTDHDVSLIKEGLDTNTHLFMLKLEQLLGSIPELKKNVAISDDVEHDDSLLGKWYNFYLKKSLWDFDTLSIYLFDSNGKHNRSVQIGNKNTAFGENWSSLIWEWFTEGNRLHIIDKMHSKEDVYEYEVKADKLYFGNKVFYRNMKDAIDHAV
jgi:hypothetical protein